ncbi:MAG TPA: substrate-binding domain-containing protein [Candidatus Limnocylindrales bacterium]|nr:substrate-binding domain-containing protein [Candidatus Limnocylindrales bacterium]
MSRRRFPAIFAALFVAAAACQPGGGTGGGDCVVGVSWNNYQQPRWAKADEPAIKKAIEAGGGKYIRADAQDKEDVQLQDIDSLINQGAKVLIVLAKDNKAILPAIEKAKARNIPVIGYDRLIEDPSVFYITFDNEKVGTLMAQEVMKAKPKGTYVVIKGHKADPNADFLRGGMDKAGLKDAVAKGDITIAYEEYTDGWKTENAQKNMEAALAKTNNKVDAVLSENDSMAIGVVAALDKVGLAGTVPVSGQDGDEANLNNVAKGLQLVDVWKDAFALGETAGNAAVQLCKGAKLADLSAPSTLKEHVAPEKGAKAQPFTTPNGTTVQSIVLKPTPITAANLDLPISLGWITKDKACAGAKPDVAACK